MLRKYIRFKTTNNWVSSVCPFKNKGWITLHTVYWSCTVSVILLLLHHEAPRQPTGGCRYVWHFQKTNIHWNTFFFHISILSCFFWSTLQFDDVLSVIWSTRTRGKVEAEELPLLETRHKQKHASLVWQMPRKSQKDYLEVQFTIRVSTCNMIYLFNQNSYFFRAIGCRVVFIEIVQIHKLCISCDYMHLQHYIRKARRGKKTRKKNECWGSSEECRPVILTSAGYVFSAFERQNINRFLSFSLKLKRYCLYASLPCWSHDLLAKSKRWPGILRSTESKQSCL